MPDESKQRRALYSMLACIWNNGKEFVLHWLKDNPDIAKSIAEDLGFPPESLCDGDELGVINS